MSNSGCLPRSGNPGPVAQGCACPHCSQFGVSFFRSCQQRWYRQLKSKDLARFETQRLNKQTVVIDDSNPSCITIKPMVLVPAEEAWLYRNKHALNLVRAGLKDAQEGNFAEAPDVDADLAWLDDVED